MRERTQTALAPQDRHLEAVPTTGQTIAARNLRPMEAYLGSLSEGSWRSMRNALETAARLMSGNAISADDVPWPTLRFEHLAALRSRLKDQYSARYASKVLSAVRGVLKAAWQLELMSDADYHRAVAVEGVKSTRLPAGRQLEATELDALFRSLMVDTNLAAPRRDMAMLAVMLGAGLRREEIASLDLGSYNPDDGALRVIGKGDKERVSYLGTDGRVLVQRWIWSRGTEPGPLFCPVTKAGVVLVRRMTAQAVYNMLQKRAQRAGIRRFSPHDLRRTYISQLLDKGVDIVTVQKMVGHSSPTTTAAYDRRGEASKRRAAEVIQFPDPCP